MKDYIIIENGSLELLAKDVTGFLRRGWKLHGSPFSRDDTNDVCQALVSEKIVHREIRWEWDKSHRKGKSKCGTYRVEISEGQLVLYCEDEELGTFDRLTDCLDEVELIEAQT